MKDLQRSHYNFFVSRDDGVMAYNARTGTFAMLSAEVADNLRTGANFDDDGDIAQLVEMGFLHEGDEYDTLLNRYNGGRSSSQTLSLTIVPTLACNRSCAYCYQTDYRTDQVMSDETQMATVAYVRSRVRECWKKVACTWYGGEPLLAKGILLNLCSALRAAIEEEGGQLLPMKIVSNGVLLDETTAQELSEHGVSSAQISFDSLIDQAPEYRGLLDLDGNPSVILRNILTAQEYLSIGVRINVRKYNETLLQEMLDILYRHGLRSNTYLARASDYEGEAGAVTDREGTRHPQSNNAASFVIIQPKSDVLSRIQFAQLEQTAMLNSQEALKTMTARLTPKLHFCGATQESFFVIDPKGDISRCWLSAGSRSEATGSVHEVHEQHRFLETQELWDKASPFTYASCSTCKVLPLCMGGCSHPRLFMGSKKSPCETIKYQIAFCVDSIGKRLIVSGA